MHRLSTRFGSSYPIHRGWNREITLHVSFSSWIWTHWSTEICICDCLDAYFWNDILQICWTRCVPTVWASVLRILIDRSDFTKSNSCSFYKWRAKTTWGYFLSVFLEILPKSFFLRCFINVSWLRKVEVHCREIFLLLFLLLLLVRVKS